MVSQVRFCEQSQISFICGHATCWLYLTPEWPIHDGPLWMDNLDQGKVDPTFIRFRCGPVDDEYFGSWFGLLNCLFPLWCYADMEILLLLVKNLCCWGLYLCCWVNGQGGSLRFVLIRPCSAVVSILVQKGVLLSMTSQVLVCTLLIRQVLRKQ